MSHRSTIITIDGPAGAGKSTVAHRLAARLKLDFLDTGAMYRGVALAVLDARIDPTDRDAVGALAQGLSIAFDWSLDPPELRINGKGVSGRLRDANVTGAVSDIASNAAVRRVLVESQRRIGVEHPRLVTEGRDQGSVVFIDAVVKFYLDASARVRARRRADQLVAMGREADVEEIFRQIVSRDERDVSRADGPLVCPKDAIRIDSSGMTLDVVVEEMEKLARQKLAGACPRSHPREGGEGGGER